MKFTATAILSVLAYFATANPIASLETTGPNPADVYVQSITYGGSGCPQGTVATSFSDDRETFTMIFDEFIASMGKNVPITEARKNCQLNLQLQYPGGFQYSILSADYRGYAYLEKGVTGTQQSIYYFSGQTAQADTGTSWKGPMDEDYLLSDTAVSATLVWSPCGALGMLNINSAIKLTSTNSSASGLLTTDSVDTKFTQEIYIQWQPCTTSS
jgi:hypothetical protein